MIKKTTLVLVLIGIVTGLWSIPLKGGTEQNGIKIFKKGDKLPALPPGLTADIPVTSKFGFKIVKIEGKNYWEAATEADYRAWEAKRLGIKPEEVHPRSCYMPGPNQCAGACEGLCVLAYSGSGYYCTCSDRRDLTRRSSEPRAALRFTFCAFAIHALAASHA